MWQEGPHNFHRMKNFQRGRKPVLHVRKYAFARERLRSRQALGPPSSIGRV